jgi:hypothetical protein
MAYVKLTAKNQTQLFIEDRASYLGRRRETLHYAIGDHILLLSKRLDAIEALASAAGARSDETAQPVQPAGRQSGPSEASGDAHPSSGLPS